MLLPLSVLLPQLEIEIVTTGGSAVFIAIHIVVVGVVALSVPIPVAVLLTGCCYPCR